MSQGKNHRICFEKLKKTSFIGAVSQERCALLRNLPVEVATFASRVSNNEYQPAHVALASALVV
jgi:hypothetical protein